MQTFFKITIDQIHVYTSVIDTILAHVTHKAYTLLSQAYKK
jgi:hypothetical protein